MSTNLDYSDLSYKATKIIDKKTKKNNGIYFTHPSTIQKNLLELEKYTQNINSILEPSFGTGEYIRALQDQHINANITGIELNKDIYDMVANDSQFHNANCEYIHDDFITHDFFEKKYDLIIGNPPYFVIKKKDVPLDYHLHFDGRPNIFVLFILKSMKLLSENGILSFVLPRNFLNSLYFNKVRIAICESFKILNIFDCEDNFIETKQKTIIMIIQKNQTKSFKHNNNPFVVHFEHNIIAFGTPAHIEKIHSLCEGSTTLEQIGCKVSVGNVVWNENKDILTTDETKTRLIYSSDIVDKKLTFRRYPNDDKKNYINKAGQTGPILVLNRGYGVGEYKFEYCLINEPKEYLIENHLICIKHIDRIDNEKMIKIYEEIIRSFENNKTKEFIKIYFGNNAINTTELCKIMPIY